MLPRSCALQNGVQPLSFLLLMSAFAWIRMVTICNLSKRKIQVNMVCRLIWNISGNTRIGSQVKRWISFTICWINIGIVFNENLGNAFLACKNAQIFFCTKHSLFIIFKWRDHSERIIEVEWNHPHPWHQHLHRLL